MRLLLTDSPKMAMTVDVSESLGFLQVQGPLREELSTR